MMYAKVREMRQKKKYTTQYMADQLGISKPFYCQIENQTRRLSYDMAVRISAIFGKKPDAVFYEDHLDKMKNNTK